MGKLKFLLPVAALAYLIYFQYGKIKTQEVEIEKRMQTIDSLNIVKDSLFKTIITKQKEVGRNLRKADSLISEIRKRQVEIPE